MNREIKFRAWDRERKGFVYSDDSEFTFATNTDGTVSVWSSDGESDTTEPAQQFTGLCDKNGREIYEGDILETACTHEVSNNYELLRSEKGRTRLLVEQVSTHWQLTPRQWFSGFYVGRRVQPSDLQVIDGVLCARFYFENNGERHTIGYDGFEIVGNVWEIPELLEKEDAK